MFALVYKMLYLENIHFHLDKKLNLGKVWINTNKISALLIQCNSTEVCRNSILILKDCPRSPKVFTYCCVSPAITLSLFNSWLALLHVTFKTKPTTTTKQTNNPLTSHPPTHTQKQKQQWFDVCIHIPKLFGYVKYAHVLVAFPTWQHWELLGHFQFSASHIK